MHEPQDYDPLDHAKPNPNAREDAPVDSCERPNSPDRGLSARVLLGQTIIVWAALIPFQLVAPVILSGLAIVIVLGVVAGQGSLDYMFSRRHEREVPASVASQTAHFTGFLLLAASATTVGYFVVVVIAAVALALFMHNFVRLGVARWVHTSTKKTWRHRQAFLWALERHMAKVSHPFRLGIALLGSTLLVALPLVASHYPNGHHPSVVGCLSFVLLLAFYVLAALFPDDRMPLTEKWRCYRDLLRSYVCDGEVFNEAVEDEENEHSEQIFLERSPQEAIFEHCVFGRELQNSTPLVYAHPIGQPYRRLAFASTVALLAIVFVPAAGHFALPTFEDKPAVTTRIVAAGVDKFYRSTRANGPRKEWVEATLERSTWEWLIPAAHETVNTQRGKPFLAILTAPFLAALCVALYFLATLELLWGHVLALAWKAYGREGTDS